MKFWVGVTDNRWFSYLSKKRPDELNFWQPSALAPFVDAPVGMPFLFKLKRPNNHVAGGGHFVAFTRLPITLAWEVFGEKNGCDSLEELQQLIAPLSPKTRKDSEIGCTVLADPFFFDEIDWIPDPPGWSSNIVRGKLYDATLGDGIVLWQSVATRLQNFAELQTIAEAALAANEPGAKFGDPVSIRPRLGQSSFRVLVTEAYRRRCAITGESTLVALEAAHIVPYSGHGSHDIQNGLLLRADFHRLFDTGLVGVTPNLQIKISPRIRETWFNGRTYYTLQDRTLSVVPEERSMRPDPDRLQWHLNNVFQA
jgi:putative restriction endonuclease